MSINNFIPVIWSSRLLQALQKSLVYAQGGVVNRDYEGDIQDAGNQIRINSISDPTIVNYTKNTDLAGPETLTDAVRLMTIDQSKAFNFQVDDVDRSQANVSFMNEAMARAGYRLKDVADSFLAADMATGAGVAIGSTATPVVVTPANAYDQLVQARVALDERNVPTDGRWVIVPSWYEAALSLDVRFVGTRGYDQNSILLNGAIGQAAGFNILKSNNVPNTPGMSGAPPTAYKVIAGYSGAVSYAEQISKVEAYRPPARFADAVKGLHLYGAAVIRPYELVCVTANDGSGLAGTGPQDLPA